MVILSNLCLQKPKNSKIMFRSKGLKLNQCHFLYAFWVWFFVAETIFFSCFILLAQSRPTKKQKAKGLQKHIFYKILFLSSANTLFSSLDYSSINQKNYRIWSSFFLYIIFYRIFFINNLPRSFASRNHTQHYWSLIYTCNSFSWFFFSFLTYCST